MTSEESSELSVFHFFVVAGSFLDLKYLRNLDA